MLREMAHVRQAEREGLRRWFVDDSFDLTVWEDLHDGITAFQLICKKEEAPRAISWKKATGYSYDIIDDGESKFGGYKSTPLLIRDHKDIPQEILPQFLAAAREIDAGMLQFIGIKIQPLFPAYSPEKASFSSPSTSEISKHGKPAPLLSPEENKVDGKPSSTNEWFIVVAAFILGSFRWLLGAIVPFLLAAYGLMCIFTQNGLQYVRRGAPKPVEGVDAAVVGIFYLGASLFLYTYFFRFFFRSDSQVERATKYSLFLAGVTIVICGTFIIIRSFRGL